MRILKKEEQKKVFAGTAPSHLYECVEGQPVKCDNGNTGSICKNGRGTC